jgi:hypothetical protein
VVLPLAFWLKLPGPEMVMAAAAEPGRPLTVRVKEPVVGGGGVLPPPPPPPLHDTVAARRRIEATKAKA